MKKIFIAYRRNDSAVFTGRIYDRLTDAFGDEGVFLDIYSIRQGSRDFRAVVRDNILSSGVFVAVLGQNWAGRSPQGREIDDPRDDFRMEIEYALELDKEIIPLYCDTEAPFENEPLPATLGELAVKQGATINTGSEFDYQVNRLRREIEGILWPSRTMRVFHRVRRTLFSQRRWIAGLLLLGLAAGILRDVLAAKLVSREGIVRVIGAYDQSVFGGARPESCEVARVFPDRLSLTTNTDIASTIAGAQETFDMFALSASVLSHNVSSVRHALENNVRFRIVLIDTGPDNIKNLQSYFSQCSQRDGDALNLQLNSTLESIDILRELNRGASATRRGSIELRSWVGPFTNSMWIRDGRRMDGLAHVEVTYYGAADRNPCIRSGALSQQLRNSLQGQFDYIWAHSRSSP